MHVYFTRAHIFINPGTHTHEYIRLQSLSGVGMDGRILLNGPRVYVVILMHFEWRDRI